MNTLLRVYLVLIFASSALNAGSENDSINSGIPIEASKFASNPRYLHLEELAACMNASNQKKNNRIIEEISENNLEETTNKELSK